MHLLSLQYEGLQKSDNETYLLLQIYYFQFINIVLQNKFIWSPIKNPKANLECCRPFIMELFDKYNVRLNMPRLSSFLTVSFPFLTVFRTFRFRLNDSNEIPPNDTTKKKKNVSLDFFDIGNI